MELRTAVTTNLTVFQHLYTFMVIKTDFIINFISRQTNTEPYLNIRKPIVYVNTLVECYEVDSIHILYYHIKYTRRLKSQPIILKNCLKLYLLLLAKGVATNPGPVAYPCGHCAKPVAKTHIQGCNVVNFSTGISDCHNMIGF